MKTGKLLILLTILVGLLVSEGAIAHGEGGEHNSGFGGGLGWWIWKLFNLSAF